MRYAPSVVIVSLLSVTAGAATPGRSDNFEARVERVLAATPLIDGHNDLPWEIRERFKSKLSSFDLNADTAALPRPPGSPPLMTDIPRLHAGHLGAQFWSVWVPVQLPGPQAVQTTMEQIDLVKQLTEHYSQYFAMAYSAADIARIHKNGKIASLIGIEGGHQINNSLPVLREMYALGARYMTLSHSSNTDWADSATDAPVHNGLTPFGREVVREMNRLGMLVDLSHVSEQSMKVALSVTEAPVIFSHSSARALNDHPRDVSDAVLRAVAANGGVVMVNFYPGYVSDAFNRWSAEYSAEQARISSPPFGGLYIGQPERAKAALQAWQQEHPKPVVTLAQVADHFDHIRAIAGVDHVGIGSDFDGMEDVPQGLEGVDRYPALLAELLRRGWSDQDIAKVAGGNLLRVMAAAEAVAKRLQSARPPSEATIEELDKSVRAHAD